MYSGTKKNLLVNLNRHKSHFSHFDGNRKTSRYLSPYSRAFKARLIAFENKLYFKSTSGSLDKAFLVRGVTLELESVIAIKFISRQLSTSGAKKDKWR